MLSSTMKIHVSSVLNKSGERSSVVGKGLP